MKKFFQWLFVLVLLFFIVCLVINPQKYVSACFDGIKIWAFVVLPSLLPYFFLTSLLTLTGKLSSISKLFSPLTKWLYNTSGISAYVHVMSILSGYPVGARLISELYQSKAVSCDEATRMSTFCSTSGPLFIISSVGIAMFSSVQIGICIFLVHILSSIICGLFFRKYGDNRVINAHLENTNNQNILQTSITSAVNSILIVGGFIAIFYTLSEIAIDFKLLYPLEKFAQIFVGKELATPFVQGLVESTMGCKNLSSFSGALSPALAAGLISFGGISVICQSIVFLKKANVNIKIFIFSKLMQMSITIIACFAIFKLFLGL